VEPEGTKAQAGRCVRRCCDRVEPGHISISLRWTVAGCLLRCSAASGVGAPHRSRVKARDSALARRQRHRTLLRSCSEVPQRRRWVFYRSWARGETNSASSERLPLTITSYTSRDQDPFRSHSRTQRSLSPGVLLQLLQLQYNPIHPRHDISYRKAFSLLLLLLRFRRYRPEVTSRVAQTAYGSGPSLSLRRGPPSSLTHPLTHPSYTWPHTHLSV